MGLDGRRRVIAAFAGHDLTTEQRWYLEYNARRYLATVERVAALLAEHRRAGRAPLRVLDVAASYQTELLRRSFPDVRVDDLGFADSRFPPPDGAVHHEFDLNDARHPDRWPGIAGYHAVVVSEVVEHLWVSAGTVFAFLASGLVPAGHLVVQTPNAVAAHKRLRVLLGRSPVGPLPAGDVPGLAHLHEYTLAELRDSGRRAGLALDRVDAANHFGTGPAASAYHAVGRVLPRTLRHGFTLTFRKPG